MDLDHYSRKLQERGIVHIIIIYGYYVQSKVIFMVTHITASLFFSRGRDSHETSSFSLCLLFLKWFLMSLAARGNGGSGESGGGGSGAYASLARNAGDGRGLAGGLAGEGGVGAGGLDGGFDQLGLDEDGDDLAGGQAEGAVVQHGEDGANLARVAGDTEPGVVVVGEDVVNDNLAAGDLVSRGLALVLGALPKLVLLGEARLELEVGSKSVDLSLGGAAVAGVDADALTEKLLDGGLEGVGVRKLLVGKGELGRLDASSERRAVVRLKVGETVGEAGLEVGVGLCGLRNTVVGQLGISPGSGAVAILLSPVTLHEKLATMLKPGMRDSKVRL